MPSCVIVSGTGGGGPPPASLDGISGLRGVYSMSRTLISAYGGALYNGSISQWNDQSGNARDFITSGSPTVSTGGPNSRACIVLNSNPFLAKSGHDLITASAGYMAVCFELVALPSLSDMAILGGASFGSASLIVKNGTNVLTVRNDDGSANTAAGSAVTTGMVVAEWRHDGGNLYVRRDGGAWSAATASGDTVNLATELPAIGYDINASTRLNAKVFEAVYGTPSTADMDTIRDTLADWHGI